MPERPTLALIGLDLGDFRLIEHWAEEGALPTFARLLGDGVSRPLASSAEALHVSAWPSLYTGTGPGEHGVYFTFQPRPGEQGHLRFFEGLYGRPTFWKLLSDAGVPCAVLDAPYTHPEAAERAAQVIDWGAWARYLGPRSAPANLLRDLRRAVGDYPLGLEAHDVGFEEIAATDVGPRLIEAASAKTRAAVWMVENAPARLYFTVYGEPHAAAHYCWPRGATGPEVLEGLAAGVVPDGLRFLKDLYQEIDRGIGEIVEALPEDATVAVLSPDAITATYGGWHLLPEALKRLGYLCEPTPDEAVSGGGRARPGLVRRLRDALPADLRKSLARRLPTALRDRLAKSVDTAFLDWERTRAFCLPTDLEGCVRINLQGREPMGVVPAEDYDRECETLAADLSRMRGPGGRRVVREVVRTAERFPGDRSGHLPDLIVLWEDTGQLERLELPNGDVVEGASPDRRPGTHCSPGRMLVAGAAPGSGWSAASDVRDVTALTLEAFGVQVPEYMRQRGRETQ